MLADESVQKIGISEGAAVASLELHTDILNPMEDF